MSNEEIQEAVARAEAEYEMLKDKVHDQYDEIQRLKEENNKLKNLKYKFFDCCGDEESFTLNDYLEIGNKVYDLQEENERLNNIINNFDKLIDELNKEIDHRECGDSYIYDYDGNRITMDIGYAYEGIDFFIKELKHKLKEDKWKD